MYVSLFLGAKRENNQIKYLIQSKNGREVIVNSTEVKEFAACVIDFLEKKMEWMEANEETSDPQVVLVPQKINPSNVICMCLYIHYILSLWLISSIKFFCEN